MSCKDSDDDWLLSVLILTLVFWTRLFSCSIRIIDSLRLVCFKLDMLTALLLAACLDVDGFGDDVAELAFLASLVLLLLLSVIAAWMAATVGFDCGWAAGLAFFLSTLGDWAAAGSAWALTGAATTTGVGSTFGFSSVLIT